MAPAPRISVVVASRDRRERLGALLASLRAQTLAPSEFEVIVVDDGSADGTGAWLAEQAGRSEYRLEPIAGGPSGGPARARNAGWRRASAPVVAFTDDDCEPAPDWLERLLERAAAEPGAVIQGRTRPNPRELDRAGPFSVTREVDGSGPWWFETCNVAYPRELLERLGGFDEAFAEPLGEDTDLGWRALAAGAGREFAPAALVDHAVEDLGPAAHLRTATVGVDSVLVFRRHPLLRASALDRGVIRNQAHLRGLLAVIGLLGARRFAPLALLALPYARLLARRALDAGNPLIGPYSVAYDALTLLTTVRGDLRHRVLIL